MRDISEKFNSFNVLDFPQDGNAVYVIFIMKDSKEIPIYVGQTGRIQGRIGDYMTANFKASSDFRVGEAIRYFREKQCRVVIKYKASSSKKAYRMKEEEKIKKDLLGAGYSLLNDKGYDYRTADEEGERQKVRIFCDGILKRDC